MSSDSVEKPSKINKEQKMKEAFTEDHEKHICLDNALNTVSKNPPVQNDQQKPVYEIGWQGCEYLNLGDKHDFFCHKGYYRQNLDTALQKSYMDPYLVVRIPDIDKTMIVTIPQTGNIHVQKSDAFPLEKNNRNFKIFFWSSTCECVVLAQKNDKKVLEPIDTDIHHLRELLEKHSISMAPNSFVKGNSSDFTLCAKQSSSIRRLAVEIQDFPYNGHMQALYQKGKMLEMMAETVATLSEDHSVSLKISSFERRKARKARDILISEIASPPDAKGLSARVGLTPKRLNSIFRALYGDSVFSCLSTWRLELAHDMLINSDLQIKQIAAHVGYRHVNNFILAFSRHYGLPPAEFRKWRSPRR